MSIASCTSGRVCPKEAALEISNPMHFPHLPFRAQEHQYLLDEGAPSESCPELDEKHCKYVISWEGITLRLYLYSLTLQQLELREHTVTNGSTRNYTDLSETRGDDGLDEPMN